MRRRGFVPRAKPGSGPASSSNAADNRYAQVEQDNKQDDEFGYTLYSGGPDRIGWLLNIHQVFI
jgi:hypothetical protein